MNRRTFVGALAGVSLFSSHILKTKGQRTRSIPPDLLPMLEATHVPGIAVAGVRDGKPFHLAGGVAAAGGPPITTETPFPAASLTKPVFAWAVRDLVKQGKLDLNRPLVEYLDAGLEGDARKITAVHVLTHSTGLPNWVFEPDRLLTASFDPGSRWQYSGEGFVLLQRVVEKVVGQPIAEFMSAAVLKPSGMNNSSFAWTPEIQKTAAIGHDRRGQPVERSLAFYEQRNYETVSKSGRLPASSTFDQIADAYKQAKAPLLRIALSPNMAGSLQTTATDYAKFLARVLADTAIRPADFKPRVDVNRNIAWTLGWGVDRTFTPVSFFHWGDGPGFKNFCWVQPARKTALVFFTNGDSGAALYAWLFRDVMREDPSAFYWIQAM